MAENLVRILHISDIHRGPHEPTSNASLLGRLLTDIRRTYEENNRELDEGVPKLGMPDLITVSGDLTQRAAPDEFAEARNFLESLLPLVNNDRGRIILVPGNHDLDWKIAANSFTPSTAEAFEKQRPFYSPYRQTVKRAADGSYWIKDDATYTDRFRPFKEFFDSFYQGRYEYSLDRSEMFTVYDFREQLGVVAVGFNSCDEIDAFRDASGVYLLGNRASINSDAIYNAANAEALREPGAAVLIGVFHHNIRSVEHGEDFIDPNCIQVLRQQGFELCLHGHVHDPTNDIYHDQIQDRRLPVLGAGSLAAPYQDRPPAAPQGYNLVVIDRDSGGIWVHTRRSDEKNQVWTPNFQWKGKPYIEVRSPRAVGNRPGQSEADASTWPENNQAKATPGSATSVPDQSLLRVEGEFNLHTVRALRLARLHIPGIPEPLPRSEVAFVEDQLQLKKPVVLVGEPGTGKSGIAAILSKSAAERGTVPLLLDARRVEHIRDEADLRRHFSLDEPLAVAVARVGAWRRCRLVIDQLDNTIGSESANVLVELALDCGEREGVEVVAISRNREGHESKLLDRLTAGGFIELESRPLDETMTESVLKQLGIAEPSPDLITLAQNLLNLELIGAISAGVAGFDFAGVMDEIDLWERYLGVLEERENVGSGGHSAEQIVADAVALAKEGLTSEDRTFRLGIQIPRPHRRLVSWGIIIREHGRVYRFRHEKLQDFIYAWDATERGIMPRAVGEEIDPHRTRNVLQWMEKIYARRNPKLHAKFLKETLDG